MAMLLSTAPPEGSEDTAGYTPANIAIEITIGPKGQIGEPIFLPKMGDDKTTLRLWVPAFQRSGRNYVANMGVDKLEYYVELKKKEEDKDPEKTSDEKEEASPIKATIAALRKYAVEVPELGWIADWMASPSAKTLKDTVLGWSKSGEKKTLETGKIIWRINYTDATYLHEIPAFKALIQRLTIERALGTNGDDGLNGTLPKIHSTQLDAPVMGCNDSMFRSWGQTDDQSLAVTAIDALNLNHRYTQLLEQSSHHIRLATGKDSKYWVWGALPEVMKLPKAHSLLNRLLVIEDSKQADEADAVKHLQNLLQSIAKGAESVDVDTGDLKIAHGYVGLGGSGKGRAAIGQMTETSLVEFIHHLLTYHKRQKRFMAYSKPYWVFGSLTVAEKSDKHHIRKVNERMFDCLITGKVPAQPITDEVIRRLKVEGVPRHGQPKLSNRQWGQLAYLAWIAPDFTSNEGTQLMMPNTTPENLLAWHIGRIYSAIQTMAEFHHNGGNYAKDQNWKNPIDNYRINLFNNPAQAFGQLVRKVSPYLASQRARAGIYHSAVKARNEDCLGMELPIRWTDAQMEFLALGMSGLISKNAKNDAKQDAEVGQN
jgi:CRISPR-associated protein (Cas_Csd1)